MSSDVAIKVENLSKCYRIYDRPRDRLLQMIMRGKKQYGHDFWALKDVSFEIKKGETVGIIGRNGSGKSTLLQMICGTLNPTSGSIQTNGRVAALLELGSGFNPEFTGRENVMMNATVLGLKQDEVIARFDDIAAFADIGEHIEQPVKTYSSGMMLRLAFAVIAHVDADILVIDEALAVGDAFFTQKCMRFLREFMKTGTILFVSHDTASVKSLCNRAIWIEKGEIKKLGTPKEVCELYLEAFYEAQQDINYVKNLNSKNNIDMLGPDILSSSNKQYNALYDVSLPHLNQKSSFGKGGAQIVFAALVNEHYEILNLVNGGEKVIFRVIAIAHEKMDAPIIGFQVKDKLGQILFGDNTFLTYKDIKINCGAQSKLIANFIFNMPILPIGEYSISTSIANGTQNSHIQYHWIHDACMFRIEPNHIVFGLVGIPMEKIDFQILDLVH